VIICPYCKSPLPETCDSCASCQIDVKNLTNLLGPPPFLDSVVTDFTGNLTTKNVNKIRTSSYAYTDRLPQCRFSSVLRTFPEDIPLKVGLFWVFNSGAVSDAESQRGENRDILFGIDPSNNRAGMIIGYGLEPFISQAEIDDILESAYPLLIKGAFTRTILHVMKKSSDLLSQKTKDIPKQFGLESMSQNTIGENDY